MTVSKLSRLRSTKGPEGRELEVGKWLWREAAPQAKARASPPLTVSTFLTSLA